MKATIGVISSALVLGVGAIWFAHSSPGSIQQSAQAATPVLSVATATHAIADSEIQAPPSDPPSGYLPYSNPQFHFALDYPSNLQLHRYDEQGGGFTAAFQDPTTNEGFEVYVTPYGGAHITKQEFTLDEPSGVFNLPTNVMIDGTQATMFYGSNAIMGDTREVWFIHGGLLYEVTTYKQLDTWLAQIMQT
jgi:hypothetical protein